MVFDKSTVISVIDIWSVDYFLLLGDMINLFTNKS